MTRRCRRSHRLALAFLPYRVASPRLFIQPLSQPHRLKSKLQGFQTGKPLSSLGHGKLDVLMEVGHLRQTPVSEALPNHAECLDEKVPWPGSKNFDIHLEGNTFRQVITAPGGESLK